LHFSIKVIDRWPFGDEDITTRRAEFKTEGHKGTGPRIPDVASVSWSGRRPSKKTAPSVLVKNWALENISSTVTRIYVVEVIHI